MAGRAVVDDAPDALIASAAVAPLAVPSPARPTAAQAVPGDRDPAIDLEVVLAGVTAGISVQDATGRLVYVNALAAQMAGFESPEAMLAASPEDLLSRFTLIGEDGEPFDPAELPGRLVLHGEAAEPVLIGFRLADGTEGWSLLHARATTLPDGSTVAVNTFHDVTPRVESERRIRERETRFREMAEHRRRAEDRLESVLRHMPVGVILVDASDGRLLFANDAARRLPHIRFRVGDVPLYLGNPGYRQDGSEVADDEWPLRRAIRGESVQNDVLTIVTDAGTRRSYSISASPMHDRSGGVDLVIETVTDITERVLAQERERFLAQASVVLASSLDYARTVQSVADLAVPQFADWCIVQLADEEGVPRRIAVAHRDPDKLALAIRASNDYPPDPDSPFGAAAILRDGHTEYHADITPEHLDAAARNSDHREILRVLSLRSAIAVPLMASGRILGVLTLINGESGRRFEPEDVAFAEALAERAAAAIEKARLFREGVRLAASEHARAAELNAVIRAMGEGVFVCDRDGRIILANPAAEDVFPDVEERTYADILAELDDPDELAPPLGRNGGPVELRARRGEERWIEVVHVAGRGGSRGRPARGDDRRPARRHRGAPAPGRSRHVHRRPVARAADARDDDLRRGQGAVAARRAVGRDAGRDLRRHGRRGRAPPPPGRGRRRNDPFRRRGRRRRGRARPPPAPAAHGHRVRGESLARRDVRARRAGRRCRRSSPIRRTSSRSSGTSCRTPPSTAAVGRPSASPSRRRPTRSSSGSSTTGRASRPTRATSCSSCSSGRPRRPERRPGRGSGCSSAPA